MQSYCSAVNLLFGGVLVAVAVVVCLKSILQTLSNNHSDAKDDAQWKIIIFFTVHSIYLRKNLLKFNV